MASEEYKITITQEGLNKFITDYRNGMDKTKELTNGLAAAQKKMIDDQNARTAQLAKEQLNREKSINQKATEILKQAVQERRQTQDKYINDQIINIKRLADEQIKAEQLVNKSAANRLRGATQQNIRQQKFDAGFTGQSVTLGSKESISQMQSYMRTLSPLDPMYSKLKTQTEEWNKALGINKSTLTGNVSTLTNMAQSMGNVAIGYLSIAGAQKIWDIGLQSKRLDVLKANFKGTEQSLEDFKNATAGNVTEGNLIKLSNQATDLGLSLHDQTILFSLAEDAADKYGIGIEEAFQKVVYASEGNVKGLKMIGIQKAEYEKIVKDLAKAHGSEIDKLDAETQKEIRTQAIIKASGVTYEQATNKVKDSADKQETIITTITDSWEDYMGATNKWGDAFQSTIIGSGKDLIGFQKNIRDTIAELIGLQRQAEKPIRIQFEIGNLPNIPSLAGQFKQFSTGSVSQDVEKIAYWTGKTKDEVIQLLKANNLYGIEAKEIEATSGKISQNISSGMNKGLKETAELTEKIAEKFAQIGNIVTEDLMRATSNPDLFFKFIQPQAFPEGTKDEIRKVDWKAIHQAEIEARRTELQLTSNMLGYFQEIAGLVMEMPKEFQLIFSILSDFIQGMGGGGSGIFGLLGGIVGNLILPGLGGQIAGRASAGGMIHGGMVQGIGGGGNTIVMQGDLTEYAAFRILREGNRQSTGFKGGTHG